MASRSLTPFSSSRELRGFDPLHELHREMDRLFDVFTGAPSRLMGAGSQAGLMTMPRIDVREDEREIAVSAELPGVKPSEVDLRVEGDLLTISGEKKSETERKEENLTVMEHSFGRFRRTVQLPFAPDPEQVRAECDHGVLTIHVPRQPQQERSRRIEIGGAGAGADTGSQAGEAGTDAASKPH